MEPMQPTIDINSPIREILEAKIDFHKGRLAFHQSQIDELLKMKDSALQNKWLSLSTADALSSKSSSEPIDWNSFEFSRKNIKPLILRFLTDNPGKYETADILAVLNPPEWKDDKEKRAKYMTTISQTLLHLYDTDKVNKIEQKGSISNLWELKRG
jgi:hypothetical protein